MSAPSRHDSRDRTSDSFRRSYQEAVHWNDWAPLWLMRRGGYAQSGWLAGARISAGR